MQVKEKYAGKKGMCPKCQRPFHVPELETDDRDAAPEQPASRSTSGRAGASAARASAPKERVIKVDASAAHLVAIVPTDAAERREAILGAFDSRMTPPPVPAGRKLLTLMVLGMLLVLPLFYLVALAALAFGLFWLATSSYGQSLHPAVYWMAIMVGVLLLLCLIKPLVEPRRHLVKSYPLAAAKEPVLIEFVSKICDQIGAPPPAKVEAECSTRLALDSRGGGVLTIGLPLAAALSVEQLAGLIGGQVAHVRQGAGSGPTNLIRAVNGWLWRSIYEPGRFDAWLSLVAQRRQFSAAKLLLPLRAARLVPLAVLFVPMFIGNTLASGLVWQSELDADRAAARLVGRETFAATLRWLGVTDFTWQGLLTELDFLHKEQKLPDSLPKQLAVRMLDMTPELEAHLRESVVQQEAKPFDSRPSDEERIEATRSEPTGGVYVCGLPARALFTDFDEISRQATWDYYVSMYDAQFLKLALQRVVMPAATTA
jgi:Zn-dependent protease with chaperone function